MPHHCSYSQTHTLLEKCRYSQDDFPYTTELTLEEGAAGKTDIPALIVMDDITNAEVRQGPGPN